MRSQSIRTTALYVLALACTACDSRDSSSTSRPDAESLQASGQQSGQAADASRRADHEYDDGFDRSGLLVPEDEIYTVLLGRDEIPSLTDPKLEFVADVNWLNDDDRVIVISINDETVAAPLRILAFHEIVNLTVGGEPVAATFCPLCDSATLFSRRVTRTIDDGVESTDILEFGVSGALYNSNVVMYDRTDMALWSQLGMRAISGPLAGTRLEHHPLEVVPFATFKAEHPQGKVVSIETGYERPYSDDVYTWVFEDEGTFVPVASFGDDLPVKTQGIGLLVEGNAIFVPGDAISESGLTVSTSLGPVELASSGEGPTLSIRVVSAPEGVMTAQTFYYAWSAFNPETTILR